VILVVLATDSTSWIAILISVLALIGTLGNFGYTLWRGRRRVRIRTSVVEDPILIGRAGGPAPEPRPSLVYRCTVTNTGYIGLEIGRVALFSPGGNVGIELKLSPEEQPRKLDQGEKQKWEKDLDEIKGMLGGEGTVEVIAVAADTTGKRYVQKEKDALSINL